MDSRGDTRTERVEAATSDGRSESITSLQCEGSTEPARRGPGLTRRAGHPLARLLKDGVRPVAIGMPGE